MRMVVILRCMLGAAIACSGQAQDTTWRPRPDRNWSRQEITLLTGFNQGRYGFVDIGIGHSIYGAGHLPSGINCYLGAELRPDRPELVGWKVGGYFTFGGAMGLQLVRYQEDDDGCTVLRPEIGIGIWKAKLVYAYNINLSPERLAGTNAHMVSINYALRMFTIQDSRRERRQSLK